MRAIALLNQKGGVGKTSLCHHLAGAFSRLGKFVLLVDFDPQASLSQGLFGPDLVRAIEPGLTSAEILAGRSPYPADLIGGTDVPRVSLVMGSRHASDHNTPRPWEAPVEAQACLREFLKEVEAGSFLFDVCLIDCSPNLHLCSWAALAAADHLVVPLQPEDYASQGLADVEDAAGMVAGSINPGLTSLGFALNRVVKRKRLHRDYEAELRGLYGPRVFETRIPDAVAYAEAISARKPVEQFQPRSDAAHQMRALAAEVLSRAGMPAEIPSPFVAEVN